MSASSDTGWVGLTTTVSPSPRELFDRLSDDEKVAIDFVLQEVDLDPKPAMEYFGFPFRRLEEGLRDYLS